MEYLKTLWREARPKQRVFVVVALVIVVLGLLASAAKAEVIAKVSEDGVWDEVRYTNEDVVCDKASKFDAKWANVRAYFNMPYTLNRLTGVYDETRVYVQVEIAGDAETFDESKQVIAFGVTWDENEKPDEVCVVFTATRRGEAS